MKMKLFASGAIVLIFLAVLAMKGPSASAGAVQSPYASPTPRPAESTKSVKEREILFIDVWDGTKLVRSEEEWAAELSKQEFYVLRKQGTERAYTGSLLNNKKVGTYHCAACGLAVFSSAHKYNSETGWPSFYRPIDKAHIAESEDRSIPSEVRTEVHCPRCGSHLGHVFDDGPKPTGLRYCINSVALRFKPAK